MSHPTYHTLPEEQAIFIPLLCSLDSLLARKRPIIIAIDGGSASGKSSLAALLARLYECNVLHMDDFFLQMHQRTPERFAEPGGNVDYERFRAEVLEPLAARKPFSYRPFSCKTMSLAPPVDVTPGQLTIVEGAYSMHPSLSGFYDYSVFLKTSEETQAQRILLRNGPQMQKRFLSEWIPMEQLYFRHFGIENRCDLCLCTDHLDL